MIKLKNKIKSDISHIGAVFKTAWVILEPCLTILNRIYFYEFLFETKHRQLS